MGNTSIPSCEKRRKRSIQIVLHDLLQLHAAGRFTCQSQSDPTTTYHGVRPRWVQDHPGSCSCASRQRPCKHQVAAALLAEAQVRIIQLAEKHSLAYTDLAQRCTDEIASGRHDAETVQRLSIMMVAAQHLATEARRRQERSRQIEITIRWRTSSGRVLPHTSGGELLTIKLDGVERKPRDRDPEPAFAWLTRQGYKLISSLWLDSAGYMRRKRMVYALEVE